LVTLLDITTFQQATMSGLWLLWGAYRKSPANYSGTHLQPIIMWVTLSPKLGAHTTV